MQLIFFTTKTTFASRSHAMHLSMHVFATHNGMLLLLDDVTVAASHKTMAEASNACALVHNKHSTHIDMNFYEVLQFACQVQNDSCFKSNNF